MNGYAENFTQQATGDQGPQFSIVDVGDWLDAEPPPTNPVFEGFVDIGQRAAVIGGTKRRKSFVVATMAILSASGREGIGLKAARPRKTLLVQFEIEATYMWRRVKKLCRAMGISKADIEDRLHIVNLRDQLDDENFELRALEIIEAAMHQTGAELLIIDPIYVLNNGEENETMSMRRLLRRFGTINRTTNAGLIYAMHDKKGGHYDQELSNRGSGTGLTARDYDGAVFLSPHESGDDDLTVVEFLVRHAPPRAAYCIRWEWDEDSHGFAMAEEAPVKATKARRPKVEPASHIEKARSIISDYKARVVETLPPGSPPPMMPKKLFIERMETNLSRQEVRNFCLEFIFDEDESTGGPLSPIRAYTDKGRKNKKFVDNSLSWKHCHGKQ